MLETLQIIRMYFVKRITFGLVQTENQKILLFQQYTLLLSLKSMDI